MVSNKAGSAKLYIQSEKLQIPKDSLNWKIYAAVQ